MGKKETSRRKPGPSGRAVRSGFVLILIVGVLAAAVYLFAAPFIRSAGAAASGKPDAVLRISMSGWQPTVVRAQRGRPVTIEIVNLDNRFHTDGGGWHNFVVEAFGVEERVPPKGVLTFTFVPDRSGEFLFYCDICCGGKDNPFMQGKLVVL